MAHYSHKDRENMTLIGLLFFLHIMTHMHRQTSQLLGQIGSVGRFGEKATDIFSYLKKK